MASNITLSAGVRQNLLALQNTASLLSTTQNRLATGKKVNSALDNPTNFFTSSALSSRASDLSKLLDSMANGINTVKAADNGLTAITTAVESLKATVTQARQDASWKSHVVLDRASPPSAATDVLTYLGRRGRPARSTSTWPTRRRVRTSASNYANMDFNSDGNLRRSAHLHDRRQRRYRAHVVVIAATPTPMSPSRSTAARRRTTPSRTPTP